MNLHGIASAAVAVVNPPVMGAHVVATGYTTNIARKREPTYADPVTLPMQVQALSGPELELVEGLNIAGVKRAIHLQADARAADRGTGNGGDLIRFPDDTPTPAALRGTEWLVVAVLETWDTAGWCRVAVTKQLPPAPVAGGGNGP